MLGWQKGWLAGWLADSGDRTESDGTTDTQPVASVPGDLTAPRIIVTVRKQALGALGAGRIGSHQTQLGFVL